MTYIAIYASVIRPFPVCLARNEPKAEDFGQSVKNPPTASHVPGHDDSLDRPIATPARLIHILLLFQILEEHFAQQAV
jgi:hypothetical protein